MRRSRWKTAARGRTRRIPGEMNRTEQAYHDYLSLLQKAGEIAWFAFEGLTLKLAKDTRFTPDFVVMLPDGELEIHEVKGARKNKRTGAYAPYVKDDALVKLKVAAALFPFRVAAVFPRPDRDGGGWLVREF